jgi:hypothetical protein
MQYILSEEEYKNLLNKEKELKEKYKEIINSLCRDVANHKPTFTGWDKKNPTEPKPWGCYHYKHYWHCDECSVQKVCMMEKSYSQ